MKRAIRLVAGVAIAGSMLMTPLVAFAASTCSKDQIEISLPILANNNNNCIANNPAQGGAILVYMRMLLQLLSGAVGLVIVLMLVVGGIQYLTALGDPTSIKNAKNRVTNAVIALVLFMMMFAILQFLIPGGMLTA